LGEKVVTFFYLQDGDIINIDVTVYLNVSCTFLGVAGGVLIFTFFVGVWRGQWLGIIYHT